FECLVVSIKEEIDLAKEHRTIIAQHDELRWLANHQGGRIQSTGNDFIEYYDDGSLVKHSNSTDNESIISGGPTPTFPPLKLNGIAQKQQFPADQWGDWFTFKIRTPMVVLVTVDKLRHGAASKSVQLSLRGPDNPKALISSEDSANGSD